MEKYLKENIFGKIEIEATRNRKPTIRKIKYDMEEDLFIIEKDLNTLILTKEEADMIYNFTTYYFSYGTLPTKQEAIELEWDEYLK